MKRQLSVLFTLVSSMCAIASAQCISGYDYSDQFSPAGGSGTLTLFFNSSNCSYNVATNAAWIVFTDPTFGIATASQVDIHYTVAENDGPIPRHAMLILLGLATQMPVVDQNSASCTFSVSPSVLALDPGIRFESVTLVASPPDCSPFYTTPSWIWPQGWQFGAFQFGIDANGGISRIGTVLFGASPGIASGPNAVLTVSQGTPSLPGIHCIPNVGPSLVGVPYSTTCTESWGTPPYHWWLYGFLPPGLTYSSSPTQAVISGTPTTAGPYSYELQVTDSSPTPLFTSFPFSGQITTASPSCFYPPAWGTGGFSQPVGPGGGTALLSATFNSSGCSWTVSVDSDWISFVGPTSGIVLNNTISVPVSALPNPLLTSRSATFRITVAGTLVVTATLKQNGGGCVFTVSPTQISVGATGGNIGVNLASYPLDCSAVVSAPPWISVADNATPVINVALNPGGARTGQVLFGASPATSSGPNSVLTVYQAGARSLNLVCGSSGPQYIQTNYSNTCSASGGIRPYLWSAGSLPSGLYLSNYQGTSATITGVPTSSGSYSFTIFVQDSSASPLTASQSFTGTLAPKPGPPVFAASPTQLKFATTADKIAPVTQMISVSSTPTAAVFHVSTSGGSWLSATPSTGSTPGTVSVSVDPTDLQGGNTYSGSIVIEAITIPVTFTIAAQPVPQPSIISNAASKGYGAIAPGELIMIQGSALGPAPGVSFSINSQGLVDSTLAGVQVMFDTYAGTPLYVAEDQINVVVPYEIAGQAVTHMTVISRGLVSASFTLPVADAAPGVFTLDATGTGQAIAANLTGSTAGSLNGPSSGIIIDGSLVATQPADPGSFISILTTGGGQTTPSSVTGSISPGNSLLVLEGWSPGSPTVEAKIGGIPARVTFAGAAPLQITGLVQINVQIPENISGNPLPLEITINGRRTVGSSIAVQ
jgi:uncharacterized protein (TIGR03437 family)